MQGPPAEGALKGDFQRVSESACGGVGGQRLVGHRPIQKGAECRPSFGAGPPDDRSAAGVRELEVVVGDVVGGGLGRVEELDFGPVPLFDLRQRCAPIVVKSLHGAGRPPTRSRQVEALPVPEALQEGGRRQPRLVGDVAEGEPNGADLKHRAFEGGEDCRVGDRRSPTSRSGELGGRHRGLQARRVGVSIVNERLFMPGRDAKGSSRPEADLARCIRTRELLRMPTCRRFPAPLLAVLLAGGCGGVSADDPAIDVAVSANFAEVAERLAERFTVENGVPVRLAIGSTGGLTAQILSGAPFDLFLAADTLRPLQLEREGWAVPGSRFTYAVGRLVVFAPGRTGDWSLPELLREPGVRLSWAEPRTAPYGAAAVEALERWGLGDAEGAIGQSVAQSWQFVRSGAVDAAFVSEAQVLDEEPHRVRRVPDSLYAPLRQQALLLVEGASTPAAAAFLDFLRGGVALAIIRSSGYATEEGDRGG